MIKSDFEIEIEWATFRLTKNTIKLLESSIENTEQSVEYRRLCADDIRKLLNLLEETEPSYDLRFLVALCSFINETYGHLRDYKDRGLI